MSPNFEVRLKQTLQSATPQRVSVSEARTAAVLIPIVGSPEPTLIFTVRTESLPSHKGQISFPGGSLDPGESEVDAALREANEELGIDPEAVRILGELDTFPTFVSGYVITPIVGWIDRMPEISPNPAEVAEVFYVPVSDLAEEIRAEPGFEHGGQTFPTEAWIWNDRVIWGVTARVVRSFLSRLAEAGLGDAPGEEPEWPQALP